MNSTIFIPKTINVGYQNRKSTYTGKLAYVIYYDEKGTLRKERSWNGWRDQNIPNNEFENVPTEGFVLNKHVGGVENSYGWNARKSYCRVYDPRGFEFEISIENLLYILENTNSIVGKGLEGEFVYGWDGKDLVLMPITSPDYKEISEYNKLIYANTKIKAKDLIVGATYLTKENVEVIYMGKFNKYEWCYIKKGHQFKTKSAMINWCEENNIPRDRPGYGYLEDSFELATLCKEHCFYNNRTCEFYWKKSIGNSLIDIVNKECSSEYANLFYKLEGDCSYSPIDHTKDVYYEMTFDEFSKYATRATTWCRIKMNCIIEHKIISFSIKKANNQANAYFVWTENPDEGNLLTLNQIFQNYRPMYKMICLKNGREYKKEFYRRNDQ